MLKAKSSNAARVINRYAVKTLEIPESFSLHQLRQLGTLSRFGFGGCVPIKLTEAQEDMWFDFANGKNCAANAKEMAQILAQTMPEGFEAMISKGEDCQRFFRKHNDLLYCDLAEVAKAKKTGITATTDTAQLRLRELLLLSCLDKTGEIIEIKDRSQVERPIIVNPLLLGSKMGERLKRIGLVSVNDGKNETKEHVFLDFLSDARIGSTVRTHRSIAYAID